MPVEFITKITDQVVEDERTATFECEINKSSMAAHWSKNGTQIQHSEKYHIVVEGTKHRLEIRECQKFDMGNIEVAVEDVFCAASLTVNTVDIELIKPLENISCEETPKTITFVCEFSKGDLPAQWTKNGKPVDMSKRHNASTSGTSYQLDIKNATPEDEGEYSVTVKGKTTKAQLLFLIRPTLKIAKKYEDVVVIKVEQSTAFEVPFEGYPLPIVKWLYKGEELPNVKRFTVDTTSEVTSLKVKQAQRTDRGTYTCSIGNAVCEVSADITLDVLNKPGPPQNLRVTDFNDDSVTLQWDKPADDGGSDIINYIIDKKEVAKRGYSQVAKSMQQTITIDGLREEHSYLFQVTAVNDIGKGEPVELVDAVIPKSKFSKLIKSYLTFLSDELSIRYSNVITLPILHSITTNATYPMLPMQPIRYYLLIPI